MFTFSGTYTSCVMLMRSFRWCYQNFQLTLPFFLENNSANFVIFVMFASLCLNFLLRTVFFKLTLSLLEPGGHCLKSMEISKSCRELVKIVLLPKGCYALQTYITRYTCTAWAEIFFGGVLFLWISRVIISRKLPL